VKRKPVVEETVEARAERIKFMKTISFRYLTPPRKRKSRHGAKKAPKPRAKP
jgi:hypothetical protein